MTRLTRNLPWALLALFVITTGTLLGVAGVAPVVVLATLLSGSSAGAVLGNVALLAAAVAFLVAADAALAVALLVTVVRRLSFPTSPSMARTFRVLEALVPPLRGLALSERFAPSAAERRERVKRRYVEGELTEREFEREMRKLLAETEPDPLTVDDVEPGVDSGVEAVTADRAVRGREPDVE